VANIKSAIKRIQIGERNRMRNKAYKSTVRTFMKKCLQAIDDYAASPDADNLATAQQHMSAAYSKIDKAVKRRILHRNNGARKKARLASALKRVAAVA
jgi:small subunit ribosomal protein S20